MGGFGTWLSTNGLIGLGQHTEATHATQSMANARMTDFVGSCLFAISGFGDCALVDRSFLNAHWRVATDDRLQDARLWTDAQCTY